MLISQKIHIPCFLFRLLEVYIYEARITDQRNSFAILRNINLDSRCCLPARIIAKLKDERREIHRDF